MRSPDFRVSHVLPAPTHRAVQVTDETAQLMASAHENNYQSLEPTSASSSVDAAVLNGGTTKAEDSCGGDGIKRRKIAASRESSLPMMVLESLRQGEIEWAPHFQLHPFLICPEDPSSIRLDTPVRLLSPGSWKEPRFPPEMDQNSAANISTPSTSSCKPFAPFKFAELFAGVGGFRVGLEALGGECVFTSEISDPAKTIYKANFGDKEIAGDIRNIKAQDVPAHDILTAGFPCQPFTTAGNQKAFRDTRGMMFWHVLRIALSVRPRAMLLENVGGLLECEGGEVLKSILSNIAGVGYHVAYQIVNSRSILPQYRERLYFVCIRSDLVREGQDFQFPNLPDLKRVVREVLETDAATVEPYSLSPSMWDTIRASDYFKSHPGHKLVDLEGCSNTMRASYRKAWRLYSQFIPRADEGKLPRFYTPREVARLQGFPEAFKLVGDERMVYVCLGNAVAAPVIACIGGALLCYLEHGQCCKCDGDNFAFKCTLSLLTKSLPPSNVEALLGKQFRFPDQGGVERVSVQSVLSPSS